MAGGKTRASTSASARHASPPAPEAARPTKTLVLDNGGYTLKAGIVTSASEDDAPPPRIIPNCIARTEAKRLYVGSAVDECKDLAGLAFRRPVEKGFIVNWEAQKAIWEHEFLDEGGTTRVDPGETRLVLAEPPNGLPVLQTHCDQIVFEEFGFASYYRGIGPAFNAYNDIQSIFSPSLSSPTTTPADILLLLDLGHSYSTITPLLRGRPLHPAIRRLDIGGQFLTNALTRLLSVRHFDMRNDPHLVAEIKHLASFVSLSFAADLERCWKGPRPTHPHSPPDSRDPSIARDIILPDFHHRFNPLLRPHDPLAARSRRRRPATDDATAMGGHDVLTLRNERFAVPELLFHPTDTGLRQSGLADAVMESLAAVPQGLWPGLLSNMVVVGGTAQMENLPARLEAEMARRVPAECVVRVGRPADAVTSTWWGMVAFARHTDVERVVATKQEYEECGAGWVARKFAAGLGV